MNQKHGAVTVFLAFLAMGFADAVGPFVSLARDQFQVSNVVAQLIPFAGFLMFGILSVPMGVVQDAQGKKFVLLLGLCVMLAGLSIPTLLGLSTFPIFLITVLCLGAGAAILQVAGNPIMRDVSAEGKFSRNLSLAQFVKAVGSLSGPLIPVIAARWFHTSWGVIFPVYTVAVLIAALFVLGLPSEQRQQTAGPRASVASSLGLLRHGFAAKMVLAIFVYVGAEVSVSSGIPLFLKQQYGVDVSRMGLLGTGLFFLALTVGRLSGGVILNWMTPPKFLMLTCALSLLGLVGLYWSAYPVALASFLLIGFGFANIFPLVFSITIDRMPAHANELSGLMVMAIVGGAFLPLFMGLIADVTGSVGASFLAPIAAIVYISWAALTVQGGSPLEEKKLAHSV